MSRVNKRGILNIEQKIFGELLIKKIIDDDEKNKNNILIFLSKISKLERQVEAIYLLHLNRLMRKLLKEL